MNETDEKNEKMKLMKLQRKAWISGLHNARHYFNDEEERFLTSRQQTLFCFSLNR